MTENRKVVSLVDDQSAAKFIWCDQVLLDMNEYRRGIEGEGRDLGYNARADRGQREKEILRCV